MNPRRSETIKRFLNQNTYHDLAELYNKSMEVQVNVSQDGGERIDRDFKGRTWHEWTDGVQRWKTFRIPINGHSEPIDNDSEMTFNIADHVEGIGMTGWDWQNKQSRWVAFDFDSIIGHSDKHQKKLTVQELEEIKNIVSDIDWVTVRKSASGRGLHLYVFLNPVQTNNRNEHLALGKSILSKMSALVNFDFQSKVDTNSGNFWVYHRKMKGTDGLSLIKKGRELHDIPSNWKDYYDVVIGKRKKSLPQFIESNNSILERQFEELTGQRPRIKFDEDHKKLINWLETKYPTGYTWNTDRWMLITHTFILQEAHSALKFKGLFKTIANGTQVPGDMNAFAYPLRHGAWIVRRYSQGTAEDNSWFLDEQNWRTCYFNKVPNLIQASKTFGAIEKTNGGFSFRNVETAKQAWELIGAKNIDLPNWIMNRKCNLKKHRDGRLIIEIQREEEDSTDQLINDFWSLEGKFWKKIIELPVQSPYEAETPSHDDLIRHVVTQNGENFGWFINVDSSWNSEPIEHVKHYLGGRHKFKNDEIKSILGTNVNYPYVLVNFPFKEEYPGNRQWNRNAAQLKFVPSQNIDSLKFDTWIKIINHCGDGLNNAISNNGWAKANGIINGGDYLKVWLASLLKDPLEPLPYLFFYGEQGTGKSIFHEAVSLLISNGVQRADNSLDPKNTFNAELENAVLCVIEEIDLNRSNSGSKISYNRLKDWITAKQLPIHRKGKTPYLVPNSSHWIQISNTRSACPVFSGDMRIVVIKVDDIDPIELIPKKELLLQLEKEAPDFIAELLKMEIPPSNDRLNVPVITTEEKILAQSDNMTILEWFLEHHTFYAPGKMVNYAEFYTKFQEVVDSEYLSVWTKIYTGRQLPPKHPKGRCKHTAQWMIGNLSFDKPNSDELVLPELIVINGYLQPKDNKHANNNKREIPQTN